ncbi:DUF4142 domain-containing protein [Enterobacter hormaechei]|uniref:DUF4142 domain-containing protein n=1 Tax=Enterobacter hormaechei TaxID=158836 RepID=UPI00286058DF|nr:DUF4142 domain-containing protein [Enterobacter hormaechei]WVJ12734.1 DUF4142 domain-containing protein [Enterobacter hormaechei]HDV8244893.1 DUF4142 domain-containing protein [Enterobacter hormaechei]
MHTSKTLKRLLAVSAVAAMFSTVGVQAQTTSAAQTQTAGKAQPDARLSSGDEKALKDMAQANINEVAAARLALDKAQSSEVKTFAQKMVDDHGAALTKVQTVAQKKGVELPTEPDAAHKALNSRLENQRGDAFDKMYMEYAGVKVLSKLKSDASKIDDPDVKALANEHTPVVEQHLKSAEQMSTHSGASADK